MALWDIEDRQRKMGQASASAGQLSRDIESSRAAPEAWKIGWRAFYDGDFKRWYGEAATSTFGLPDEDVIDDYQRRINQWRDDFGRQGGTALGPRVEDPPDRPLFGLEVPWWLWVGGLGLGALLLLGKFGGRSNPRWNPFRGRRVGVRRGRRKSGVRTAHRMNSPRLSRTRRRRYGRGHAWA